MSSGSPSHTVQLVGGPERRSPSSRQTGWPSSLPCRSWRAASRAGSRGELAGGEPLHHLLERERVVPEQLGVLLDVRLRRLDRLAVVVERLRLAEAGDARVPQLDDDDVLAVSRAARDDERLRQLERDDPR